MLASLKRLIADPVESVFLQVPRALAASVLALALDFGILELCVHALAMPAVPAAILGYLAGSVLQYVLCTWWVFSANVKNDAIGFIAFTLLALIGLGITWIVIHCTHDTAGLPIELAKASAVGLAFAWNFLSRKVLLFRGN